MTDPGPDRQELVRQAVSFLADPKIQAAPLPQKVQFLEAKGLTPPEIDQAIRQAAIVPTYGAPLYTPSQRWDWRDYFITAVVSGCVTYGAVSLFKKYLLPYLQPPDSTAYEQDRDMLSKQFDEAEALLKEIQAETGAVRAAMEEQKQQVGKTTSEVNELVVEIRQNDTKTRDEMREIREEVNNIREMMPKMMDRNRDAQTQAVLELQQELKSLKALLLTRTPSSPSPLPAVGRPTIPAWQLASTDGAENGLKETM